MRNAINTWIQGGNSSLILKFIINLVQSSLLMKMINFWYIPQHKINKDMVIKYKVKM